MDKIDELIKMIKDSKRIVFFGGAGVSTESGLKDFRSKDGLYNEKYDYPPEEILSHTFFINNTSEFYKFYKDKLNSLNYKPNITHKVLKKMEDSGKLTAVITQNIDGFDKEAGVKNVIELHGTVRENYCMKCHKFYDAEYIFNSEGIPKCTCGGVIKPNVVLYEEGLDQDNTSNAIKEISNADMLIIGGTSLTVYPAAAYVNYFRGKYLVVINNEKTIADSFANLVINEDINEVFKKLR
jgi:NAD-dependent deacetylase